jgi:perosamine synthetase
LLESEKERNDLMQYLSEKGIGTRTFYPPIHTQPPYAYVKGDFRNADTISAIGLWLPSSSFLTNEDIEKICMEIKRYFSIN